MKLQREGDRMSYYLVFRDNKDPERDGEYDGIRYPTYKEAKFALMEARCANENENISIFIKEGDDHCCGILNIH